MNQFADALQDMLTSVAVEAATEAIRQYRIMEENRRYEGHSDRFLLRSHEAAEQLAISPATLNRLTRSGEPPCVRLGRSIRYSNEAIRDWIRQKVSVGNVSPRAVPTVKVADKTKKPSAKSRTTNRSVAKERTKPKPTQRKPSKKSPRTTKIAKEPEETLVSPFDLLLEEIGVDRKDLPPLTNGDLMRIAEVDTPALHGWQWHNRQLPDEALERLRHHFIQYRRDE